MDIPVKSGLARTGDIVKSRHGGAWEAVKSLAPVGF
jgi:hypothetical protein